MRSLGDACLGLFRVDRAIGAGADQRADIVRPRDASEAVVEDVGGDPLRDMERGLKDAALRRVDQPDREVSSVTCSATAFAATMNISSVTRVASLANTAIPIAGKM